ncbi:MAG: hypothetical protein HYY50_04135 [Candidatus Kerfeldbacteria bacterium]|nr:hypothetical protein [Candidatus Kerfeldbacteria bacterium]
MLAATELEVLTDEVTTGIGQRWPRDRVWSTLDGYNRALFSYGRDDLSFTLKGDVGGGFKPGDTVMFPGADGNLESGMLLAVIGRSLPPEPWKMEENGCRFEPEWGVVLMKNDSHKRVQWDRLRTVDTKKDH